MENQDPNQTPSKSPHIFERDEFTVVFLKKAPDTYTYLVNDNEELTRKVKTIHPETTTKEMREKYASRIFTTLERKYPQRSDENPIQDLEDVCREKYQRPFTTKTEIGEQGIEVKIVLPTGEEFPANGPNTQLGIYRACRNARDVLKARAILEIVDILRSRVHQ